MSRIVALIGVACLVLFVSVREAAAQGMSGTRPNFQPYYRPQLSPFLNLGRGGNPGINYYLGTMPEDQRRLNFDYLNSSLQSLEQKTQAAGKEEALVNPIVQSARPLYGNLGPYYGNTAGYFGSNGPRFGIVQQPKIGEPTTRQRQ